MIRSDPGVSASDPSPFLRIVGAILSAAAVCAGCASSPKSADDALANAKKIAIVKYQPRSYYFVSITSVYGSGNYQAGYLAALMLNSYFDEKGLKLTQAINIRLGPTNLEKEFQELLAAILERRGFEVTFVPGSRDENSSLNLDSVTAKDVDAIIDLSFRAGYVAAGPTTDYHPTLYLDLNVYSPDKQKLFHKFSRLVPPPKQKAFADFDVLLADPAASFVELRKHALEKSVAAADLLRGTSNSDADSQQLAAAIASFAAPGTAPTPPGQEPVQSAAVQDDKLPRALRGPEIERHFARYLSIDAQPPNGTPFTLKIRSNGSTERWCTSCRPAVASGSMQIKQDEGLVCFDWPNTLYPTSGCYRLVQLTPTDFVMRGNGFNRAIRYSVQP